MSQTNLAPVPGGAAPPAVQPGPGEEVLDAGNIAVQPNDYDDAEIEAARRAVEIEAAGGTPPAAAPPAAPRQPAARPAQQPAAGETIMVPKARLDEALAAARANATAGEEWRNRSLYMEGVLAATKPTAGAPAAPRPAAQPAPAAPTVEQQILDEQSKLLEVAKRFDSGEILAADLVKAQNDAANLIQGLREKALFTAVLQHVPAPQVGMADQQMLDHTTVDLEQRYPWCVELKPIEFEWLDNIAAHFFHNLGQPITRGNVADAIKMQNFVAQLTDVVGPWMYPSRIAKVEARRTEIARAAAPPPNPGGAAAAAPPAPPAPNFAARFLAHPPNLHTAGTPAVAEQELTEDRIVTMSQEELEALPAATRLRLLERP